MFKEALGHAIRIERTNRGYNLRDVSNKAYVALGYLSEIERGQKEASSLFIERIASALGLSTSDLIYRTAHVIEDMEQHRKEIDNIELELAHA